ncbi:MAG: hypothetical protein DRI57_14620 [Deltaproteobacteria bacterium]|nr:MAG: hypothetical protein DRI57_14620 [Deltaproteobacteria bacterium]
MGIAVFSYQESANTDFQKINLSGQKAGDPECKLTVCGCVPAGDVVADCKSALRMSGCLFSIMSNLPGWESG